MPAVASSAPSSNLLNQLPSPVTRTDHGWPESSSTFGERREINICSVEACLKLLRIFLAVAWKAGTPAAVDLDRLVEIKSRRSGLGRSLFAPSQKTLSITSPDHPMTRSPDSFPSLHRRNRPLRSACIRMNRCRSYARAFIAQVLRTVKHQADRLSAIDACRCVVANHSDCDFAHDEVSGFAPGWLEETEDWDAMVGHWFISVSRRTAVSGGSGWVRIFAPDPTATAGRYRHVRRRMDVRCRPLEQESLAAPLLPVIGGPGCVRRVLVIGCVQLDRLSLGRFSFPDCKCLVRRNGLRSQRQISGYRTTVSAILWIGRASLLFL
jgi:hypothetical protein